MDVNSLIGFSLTMSEDVVTSEEFAVEVVPVGGLLVAFVSVIVDGALLVVAIGLIRKLCGAKFGVVQRGEFLKLVDENAPLLA